MVLAFGGVDSREPTNFASHDTERVVCERSERIRPLRELAEEPTEHEAEGSVHARLRIDVCGMTVPTETAAHVDEYTTREIVLDQPESALETDGHVLGDGVVVSPRLRGEFRHAVQPLEEVCDLQDVIACRTRTVVGC